jgi:hypothetical protein
MADDRPVITNGYGLYVKLRRGVYGRVNRHGVRRGGISSEFKPRPRWRLARICSYDIAKDGLTCPRCGLYDNHYAATGERSFCAEQRTALQAARSEASGSQ